MNYKIRIEVGFAGISKEYVGEVIMGRKEKDNLKRVLIKKIENTNPKLRDGFVYSIDLWGENFEHRMTYDESNLPESVRQWIEKTIEKSG
ncbi:hypothetical protein [Ulvibacterium marinum]|uniref:Uncharacterized protein n=1 Tax=Ulvibacterium marinum TaxID=2419782 RepID=A0A3B0C4K2_9FLAO|nr:hypothetical protein [Ulvibacterium marinum]RKN81105.1 hypothetical protein D7Z94_09175 [Ulvibacterium marinum]